MLEQIRLENFKSFKDQEIELRPLTLLSGLNGMGKSSVLQSLLLLRQSYQQRILREEGGVTSGLLLNGELVQLGTGYDILFSSAEKDEIRITLQFDSLGKTAWRFEYDRQTDVLKHVDTQQTLNIYESSLFTTDFQYLQAERLGPRTSYDMADFTVRSLRQIGSQGQFTAHFLNEYRDTDVEPTLVHPKGLSNSLLDQVAGWMGEVSPGTMINVEKFGEMDLMRLMFGFARADTVGDVRYYRPTNVGFGISYTLPVLIALLSAKPGALILLENPEAHLHPRGQSQIGDLIARAAGAGIQVILETHSDHILNGIRIAVRQGRVAPEQVALHFFQRPEDDSENMGIEVLSPEVNHEGRLDFWPDNFFDEWGKSLDKLLYEGARS